MGAIDVGYGAVNGVGWGAGQSTLLCMNNPANDSGTLTSFSLWCGSISGDVLNAKMGTFSGSGTSWDDRDYESLGTVTVGSKQTFSGLDCDVETGDILGMYNTSALASVEYVSTGSVKTLSKSGDQFGSGAQTYGESAISQVLTFEASGETASGWSNIAKVGGIASASIAKVNGIAVANIAKINGIAV